MDRLRGKVALITGAARGQGRAEAFRFAEEGADLILVDLCAEATEIDYVAASADELADTVAGSSARGAEVVHAIADVRDLTALEAVVADGVARFGRLDVVVANAGVLSWGRFWEMAPKRWQDMIDVNLTGVYNTLRSAVPPMLESGRGGSMIATSSVAGLKPLPGLSHYSAAKAGVLALTRSAAVELAPYRIRVNSLHPGAVRTAMRELGPQGQQVFADNPSYSAAFGQLLFDPPMSEPEDIAEAALFLASDESRTITGVQLPVDNGSSTI